MTSAGHQGIAGRYGGVEKEKAAGATYTPRVLSDFVAKRIAEAAGPLLLRQAVRILDPAVGDGELLVSLLEQIEARQGLEIAVYGFETNPAACDLAAARLRERFPCVALHLEDRSFLEFVLESFVGNRRCDLFCTGTQSEGYDLIIANPPYVRTQIIGAAESQFLARKFGLAGRVDLYHAFILGMAAVLKPDGIAGIIVSNRFMATKSGAPVRRAIRESFRIRHVWDLGDTKLFGAAVLPAVLLLEGRGGEEGEAPPFTSIYQTADASSRHVTNLIEGLSEEGIIDIDDGRRFRVQQGKLAARGAVDAVWRRATPESDAWLSAVEVHTWRAFRAVGRIRVGVKTCADKVFIRDDWCDMPDSDRPELLRPLSTHHVARRFKPLTLEKPKEILYPYEMIGERRQVVDLSRYPRASAYLERNRNKLESRQYLIEAGREWYEIWVPQDPLAWNLPKLVFRDIAEKPTFWIDEQGSIVNGDCYWLVCEGLGHAELLWLAAAIGNSTFIEAFYDHCFLNKLYAGRRRFITQYVERFPLPDPTSDIARGIVALAKRIYCCVPSPEANDLQQELNQKVWQSFGLVEEGSG